MDRVTVPGFRQVNPVEARMGTFLDTFPCNDAGVQGLKRGLEEAEKARKRHKIKGEIVYTKMNRWGRGSNNDTWQIYLIRR